ncbi:FAD/NAD(P)-binding domain-containing protein [Gonapodya prolifera JEL478]|uniref:FAD/NAD(P)-binding domain-containing protein n=1 Tax=Gonapodya prolifera (strain JEL478) TaxID=1344416 RepID=A0A139AZP7_GONPJ|nr:FAD/NAD(P)-binding domain-containing protein [Gonapodya prolifera JEL478]|eukprot:KXS22199.1 FAD/NAD(P)-binding domain-containing protein [Gonapodya prolifera JEL478]
MGPSVMVIGAGPAGALAALALKKRGFDVVICEKRGPYRGGDKAGDTAPFWEVGGSVSLYGNGLRGLDRLGLLDDVMVATGGGAEEIIFMLMDGTDPIRRKQTASRDGEHPPIQILRSTFHGILMRACDAAGIQLFLEKRLVGVSQTPTNVTATFADRTSLTADFLVAADGINSIVRTLAFPEAKPAQRVGAGYVGVFDLGMDVGVPGVAPLRFDNPMALYMDPLDASIIFTVHCPEDNAGAWILMQLRPPQDEEDPDWRPYKDLPKESARLASIVDEWKAPKSVSAAIRYSKRITPLHMYDLPDMDTLHRGRILLVGDSGHGMLPTQGQGLCQAIEDCAVIYDLFGRFPDLSRGDVHPTVFRLYDSIRLKRVHFVASASRQVAAHWTASSGVQMRVGRFVFRTIVLVKNLFGLNDKILAHNFEADVEKALAEYQRR